MRWTWIIVSALLAAGCSQIMTAQPSNPCAPGVAQSQGAGGMNSTPTPHLVARGTSEGFSVVCE